MGSFSWLKADKITQAANVYYGSSFKFLIPEIYGGGYIKDKYRDYGDLVDVKKDKKYDMYEILAFWNHEMKYGGNTVGDGLEWKGKYEGVPMPFMKEVDEFTRDNRAFGINIGCYDREIKKLKYPLKLVSFRNNQTYEECTGISLSDPFQGCFKASWKMIDKEMKERRAIYEEYIKKEVKERAELQRQTIASILDVDPQSEKVKTYIEEYSKSIEKGIRERERYE